MLGREATTLDKSEVTTEAMLDTAVGIAGSELAAVGNTLGSVRLGATTGTDAGRLVGRGTTGLRSEETTEVTFPIGRDGIAVPVGTGAGTLGGGLAARWRGARWRPRRCWRLLWVSIV